MLLKKLLFTFTLLSLGLQAAAAVPAGPLRMGVFPYHSPEQLVRLHQPLKDFLEAAAGHSTRLVSAPDFDRFIERTEIIGESKSIPGFAVLRHSDLPAEVQDRIRDALFSFGNRPRGEAYFTATGLEGMREPGARDYARLDVYLERIRSAEIP